MSRGRTVNILLGTSLLTIILQTILPSSTTYAESYVAGQFGATLPQDLSGGVTTQDGIGGLDISDQPLKSSINLGIKLGHYFRKTRWMGVETGLSYTTPHIKQGSLTLTGPGGSLTSPMLPGAHQRMIIWDMVTVMLRYPGSRLQPYIGVGPALFFASIEGPTAPPGQSGTAIGLNAEAGARYFITRHWALFGEGTYHRARIGYSSNDGDPNADPFGFRATYSAFTANVGISYHF